MSDRHVARYRIRNRTAFITVVGQGYVGLPLSVEFARSGFAVAGLDIDGDRVAALNLGQPCGSDVAAEDLRAVLRAGRFTATTDPSILDRSDAVIVCVPTPRRKSRKPDISIVLAAAEEVARRFRPGQLVILESTSYPGVTEELVLPMFQRRGAAAGADLFLACSPERIDPGNPTYSVRNIPKVVGGVTAECARLAALLYRQIVPTVVEVGSARVAELAKLYENAFRSVNIALANELALMCSRHGVNSGDVIAAAASKPFGFMPFYPGPGIGVPAAAGDLGPRAGRPGGDAFEARVMALADEINQSMPGHVVDLVGEALGGIGSALEGARILVLGVAYKRGVSDARESPAQDVIACLLRRGAAVAYADPHVPVFTVNGVDFKAVEATEEALREADGVVVLADHAEFDYEMVAREARLIVDTRQAIPKSASRVVRL